MSEQLYTATIGPSDEPNCTRTVRILRDSFLIGFRLTEDMTTGERLLLLDSKLKKIIRMKECT